MPACRSEPDEALSIEVPRDENGVETWDLRQPPSAAHVGIAPGDNTAIYSTRPGRPVKVMLPEDVVIVTDVTTVTFDNFRAPDGVSDPTTLVLSSAAMDTSDAMVMLEGYLAQLGIGNETIARWKNMIANEQDGSPSRAGDSTTIGYLDAGVSGRHQPTGDASTISWAIVWRIDPSDANPA